MLFACYCVYFSVFLRLEEGEGLQEDPEDPDYEVEQEEEFAEGKFHYSLVILIDPTIYKYPSRACFQYYYCIFISNCWIVNSYLFMYHALLLWSIIPCKTLEGPQLQLRI